MSVRVRFPPSPTGYCHVGTARMALLNYLFARKNGGQIVFRSEDTDRERSTKEFEEDIIESIKWLGLEWDELYRQSERTSLYTAALQKLIAADKAYISEEPSKKDASVMSKVVRLRNPGKVVTFSDVIRGDITFDTTELKDFVIARAIDDPLYHLSVVVDDAEHKITHVIRGEEHISNTPRQILIQEALGYERPIYAHYPLFLGADKSKLSKRKGDVAVRDYREAGYLPEALLNYIATLGWTPPSGKEILALQEMVDEFDLSGLHKSGAVFDLEKLRWYNREYLLKLSDADFMEYALPVLKDALMRRGITWSDDIGRMLVPILKERIAVADDIRQSAGEGEFDFFFNDPSPESHRIPDKKSDASQTAEHLRYAKEKLSALNEFSAVAVKDALWDYAAEKGRGAVLWPLRYSLSGRDKSPDPFIIASIIGKDATLRRIDFALSSVTTV